MELAGRIKVPHGLDVARGSDVAQACLRLKLNQTASFCYFTTLLLLFFFFSPITAENESLLLNKWMTVIYFSYSDNPISVGLSEAAGIIQSSGSQPGIRERYQVVWLIIQLQKLLRSAYISSCFVLGFESKKRLGTTDLKEDDTCS